MLEDNWVISASFLLILGHWAVYLRLILIIIHILDMDGERLEVVRERLLSKFGVGLVDNGSIDLEQR